MITMAELKAKLPFFARFFIVMSALAGIASFWLPFWTTPTHGTLININLTTSQSHADGLLL